ncbi:MAG: Mpo1-like protein [Pyrinomonadaceae bacterium]
MPAREFKSFSDFWPYYLSEHRKPATRLMHCIGTITAIAFSIAVVVVGRWWLVPLALVPGYAFAWIAHFFVEKNRPATFTYPLWSFIGDWKMLALMLSGRLKR